MAHEMSHAEETLRQVFKYGNRLMVLLFRLGLGQYGNRPETSQIMVLVHTGRKSGRQYRTPMNYAIVEGDIYVTAAFGERTDWYRNLVADSEIEVWLRDGWWAGEATEVPTDDPHRPALMRQVLIASGFAAPVFAGMNPRTISDSRLAEISAQYKLIRIQRTVARTGPGGPGDLAWIWPLATTVLLGLVFLRTRRQHSPELRRGVS